jgi:hypothetical protein
MDLPPIMAGSTIEKASLSVFFAHLPSLACFGGMAAILTSQRDLRSAGTTSTLVQKTVEFRI